MKLLIKSLLIAPILVSCAHKTLDRTLNDSSLDSLRHESLTRYSDEDLKKMRGTPKNIALCHQGRYDEALQSFKDVLDKNLKNPVYWNHLGTCYYLKGEFPKSLIYLEISMGLTKNKNLLAAIHNNVGLNHLKQNNLAEAKDAFQKAISQDNSSLTPQYNLAQLYLSRGLYDKAESALKKLLNKNSKDVDINYSLGHLYLMKNKYSKAIRHFKMIPHSHLKRDDVALNLATTYYFMGKYEDAMKTLEQAPMKVGRFTIAQTELKKRIERKQKK